ncbi:MAG: UDP-N-acetylmuramate--L-alanine ligase [Candidatus Staskawiczbacteria bacterium]|nr:UDP-N-acetylmuramate--L-alanine ligase [Candidatus Staskawiczbacteria bacterium]
MRIHFIGIGGIGMSSLAQYYHEKGHQVFGSDLVSSEITELLKEKGVGITIGQYEQNIKEDFDLVIYSPAVPAENSEYKRALELDLRIQSYPEALGELTKQYFTIAVSGSHGKSTTTALISLILLKAKLDPTVILGTKLKEFGDSNFRMGKSNFLVIEACEYDDSFNNYQPKITVVTNIDKEHLDYFKTFANVVKAFKKFILKLPEDGFLVANKDDLGIKKVINSKFASSNQFSIKQFSIKHSDAKKLRKILKIPGDHNVSNALASLELARILNVKDEISFKALSEYRGSWRRFEIKEGHAEKKHIIIVSDYGHHPNEVSATLIATREKYPKKKIWLVYQPHQYQRTHYLFSDFVKVFRGVKIDEILITEIYDVAGREEKQISSSVSSESLVKRINKKNVRYMNFELVENFIKENIKAGDILVVMGAGDIYKLADKF